ncbi:ankyrin repeat domain-containing protein [Actinoplanes sp. CA-252034]|uniref:ankyrin repeat domain-containing protein n=1 Tax=Actinoplanes sp. CA-252034 TaxID=3239906 RepID=UPI003D96B9CA
MTTMPSGSSWTTPDTVPSPAHLAVEAEDLQRLRELLDGGADVDDPDAEGMTLLHHAVDIEGDGALQSGSQAHVDVTALLLLRGADPHARNDRGATPLDLAREYGHWLAIELIEAWQVSRSA